MMFKFILGIAIGIAIMHWWSDYAIVRRPKCVSIDNAEIISVKLIPDSWKSIVENYWKEKQNNEQ